MIPSKIIKHRPTLPKVNFIVLLTLCRKVCLDVLRTVTMMRSQRMRMVPSSEHYHDIFKCLRDEILHGGLRKTISKKTIKEGDGFYTTEYSMEAEGYYDLDASNYKSTVKNENYYDRDKTYYSSGENYYGYAETEVEGYYELDTTNVKSTTKGKQ